MEKSHAPNMQKREYYTYIMMNKWNTVSYVGMTGELLGRVWQYQQKVNEGFTKKYNINKLVYYETFDNPNNAIAREKQLKRWSKKKKVGLVKKENPELRDLLKDWEV